MMKRTIVLLLSIASVFIFLGCQPNKKMVYSEDVLLKTSDIPDLFTKVQAVIPVSNGDLAFRYEAKTPEGYSFLKYLSRGYEYDSEAHQVIENIIPLKNKEVVYTTTTPDGTEVLYKKHKKIYSGSIKAVQTSSQDEIFFLAVEDGKNVLYNEQLEKLAEYFDIKEFILDSEGNPALIYGENSKDGRKIKYKGFESEEMDSIFEIDFNDKNELSYISKNAEKKLTVHVDEKAYPIEGDLKQINHFETYDDGNFIFSAQESDTQRWKVVTKKESYYVDGQVQRVAMNNYDDILVSYRGNDGITYLQAIGDEKVLDTAQQISDIYLDDSRNYAYIKKGDYGEWQLMINGESIENFVRLDKFYNRDGKIYTAGEKSNGDLAFIELK